MELSAFNPEYTYSYNFIGMTHTHIHYQRDNLKETQGHNRAYHCNEYATNKINFYLFSVDKVQLYRTSNEIDVPFTCIFFAVYKVK